MAVWYTADPHFGHEKVIDLCERPFKTANHMEGVLIENMWKVVQPDDALWIVGDCAVQSSDRNDGWLENLFMQLPGATKHLVVGNHDGPQTLDLPWDSIDTLAEVQDGENNLKNTLCHYPMITWNGARKGSLNIFGHVHNNWKGTTNAINVGVDQWDFMPVSLPQIIRRARSLPENKHWKDVEHGALSEL